MLKNQINTCYKIREIHLTESEKYMLQNLRNTCYRLRYALQLQMKLHCRWIICAAAAQIQVVHRKNDPTAGVRKGIRQTEFCHYFRTRAFAGTEGQDVLRLTQAEDLVRTA